MKTKFQSTKKFEVLGLILVCAFGSSSTRAVASAFEDNSEKIVFMIDDGQRDIYTMDPDGSNLTNITNTPALSEGFPRWSPDGKKISFYCETDIWIMNRDGSNRINLTQTPGFYEEPHSWSPDGSEIVYSRRLGFDRRIYVMNSDGTNHNELTSGHADDHPCWSPDGSRIAFERSLTPGQPTGHRQIYVMNSDGTDVNRIVYNNDEDFNPAWSPNGTRILFLSTRGGNVYRNQIFVGDFSIGPDGVPVLLNQTNITNNQWRHGCPRWSPDGNRIVYCRAPYNTVDHDIWVSNADGSGLVQLTNTPGIPDADPDWAIIPKPNQLPIADAGPDQTLEQESYAGTEVTLDGSGSTDPDSTSGTNDDIIGFEWYEGATLLGIGETIKYTLPLGSHTVTLKVTDSFGETDEDEVIIVVVDTTPPTIICPADVTVEQESHAGTVVPLEATATDICDPDPDITSDEPAIYPLGVTTVTFTATDASGNIASRSMTVTVVDTTPPDLACSTDPDKLWPRNNQMVSVDIFVEASDICTETSDLYLLVEVTSSDPDDTKNGEEKFMGDVDGDDGYTAPVDVTDTFDPVVGGFLGSVELRAECVGKNNRVYVVTTTVIDFSGNLTTTNCEVLVEAAVHGRP